jgi:dTDP-L-rhamnose 4-epimerase
MKVLITGGAGFIGLHLCKRLLADGLSVRVMDSLSPQIHGDQPSALHWLSENSIEFLRGSVTDVDDLKLALADVSHVVHLAAETGTGQSMYEIARYNNVNSQGTALLFDVLTNTPNLKASRFVLSSSRSIYGEGAYYCKACQSADSRVFPMSRTAVQMSANKWEPLCLSCGANLITLPTRENDQIRPASIYAATKYAQEDLTRIACEALGIGYAILRFQNVYGEGQSLKNPYTGILSIFSTRVRHGLELTAFEDGLETRDFVHVEDVVESIHRSLFIENPVNDVINVGSGVATNVIDMATKLTAALGAKVNIRVTGDYRIGDIRHNVADITKLKTRLGFTPSVSLDQGLSRFADWVLKQPLPEDLLGKANEELRVRKLMGSSS